MSISNLSPLVRNGLHISILIASVGLCLILLPSRLPGMEILGTGPSWLVMWIIIWSLNRSIWHAATAGIVLGLIQDGMTFPTAATLGTVPTHVLSLTIVGVLAFWLHKQRYLDNTILSASIAAFFLTLVSEFVTGLQYFLETAIQQSPAASMDGLNYLWTNQSSVVLIAAILSGFWMPILYYPLNFWWQKISVTSKFG